MAYQRLASQPPPRDSGLGADVSAPGLFPGETVFRLDTGELVAVSVHVKWLPTNSGVVMVGRARWVDEDGRTHLYDDEHNIETTYPHSVSTGFFEAAGPEEIAREVALLMLGEDPNEVDVHVDGEAPPPAAVADGTALDPSRAKAPLLDVSDDTRRSASIRHAIANVGRSAPADMSKLLG